jgi:hypothetical protein
MPNLWPIRSGWRIIFALLWLSACLARRAAASTYVVYIPLDSAIYTELDTLNSLGLLETYLQEVRPIARVEAARLTLEAERMMGDAEHNGPSPALPLAKEMVEDLRAELAEEIQWLENNAEDDQPTMVVPLQRIEAQYVYSTGQRRNFGPFDQVGEQLHAVEATPLLPNNDDLPTSVSSNEVVRTSAWLGIDKFFTAYGEEALAGPLTSSPAGVYGSTRSRLSLLRGEAVADFGNAAVSFGEHEMYWGTGYYGALSQGDNARPFPALRVATVHPAYLPGFLRYLGPFRSEAFFGQLDHGRVFSRPWLSGQIIVFKPLSTFELGLTHVVMFGGQFNNQYGWTGFVGRATGISTGDPSSGNTNSEAGFITKFYFPSLRNSYLYLDVLGEDNLTLEVPAIGRLMPFAAVSYQGGVFVPRVTTDGLTTARLEFIDTSQRYGFHSDSLYWTYKDRLMDNPVGPNAFAISLTIGRWLNQSTRLDVDYFHTERDPQINLKGGSTEFSNGVSIEALRLPQPMRMMDHNLVGMSAYFSCEYVHNLNTVPGVNSFRVAVQISVSLTPTFSPFKLAAVTR